MQLIGLGAAKPSQATVTAAQLQGRCKDGATSLQRSSWSGLYQCPDDVFSRVYKDKYNVSVMMTVRLNSLDLSVKETRQSILNLGPRMLLRL